MRLLHNGIIRVLIWTRKLRGKYLFKQWIVLEGKKKKILEAVQNKQPDFPDLLLDYLWTALGVGSKYYDQADWFEIIKAFYFCLSLTPIIKLPLTEPHESKEQEASWNYDGRMWHVYSHMLAKAYGWDLEYISQLQPDEAMAKIQEILTDEQLDREFYYGLSEIAYPYNPQSKKSIFKPLERPHWMHPKMQPIPRFQIPKAMLPAGTVIMDGVLPEEYLPKEI